IYPTLTIIHDLLLFQLLFLLLSLPTSLSITPFNLWISFFLFSKMPTTPLLRGQLFQSFEDLKSVVEDWSIADKFAFRMHLKDKDRADYRCKFSTIRPARPAENAIICQWRVFASRTRTGDIKI